jgi:predicted DNA-binding transcriptional regulator AlpA
MASSPERTEISRERKGQEWLTPQQLSGQWGIPIRTLYAWRTRRLGPKAVRIGKHLRYRRDDVEAWVEEQDRTQNGDEGS